MKIAVISDVHSNLLALNLALDDCKRCGVDKIFYLGDYITDGEDANEILELVKNSDVAIMGNREQYMLDYDESKIKFKNYKTIAYTYNSLSKHHLNYIKELPKQMIREVGGYKILLIHGEQYFKNGEVTDDVFDSVISDYDFDICLFGHIHTYLYKEYKGKKFLCPGSVGQPTDTPTYKYCILEFGSDVQFSLREIPVAETFDMFQESYRSTNYYKENPSWGELIVRSVRDGKDYLFKFINAVFAETNKIENIDAETFNRIWDEKYEEYEKTIKK